jgi:enoyl-CoA hydratase/carnithine racemase
VRFSSVGPAIVMPIVIGYKARELLYFGDTIDARAALELGMVNGWCKLGKASLRRANGEARYQLRPRCRRASHRALCRGSTSSGCSTRPRPNSASRCAPLSPKKSCQLAHRAQRTSDRHAMRAAMAAYRTGILRFNSGADAAARSPLMAVFIAGALVPLEP